MLLPHTAQWGSYSELRLTNCSPCLDLNLCPLHSMVTLQSTAASSTTLLILSMRLAYLHASLTYPMPHKALETLLRFELRCSWTSAGGDTGSFTEVEEDITSRPEAISAERTERLLLALFNSPPERVAVCCGVRMDLEEGECKERAKAEETRFTSVFHSPPFALHSSPSLLTQQNPLAMLPFPRFHLSSTTCTDYISCDLCERK